MALRQNKGLISVPTGRFALTRRAELPGGVEATDVFCAKAKRQRQIE
ncbi:hypothetical protein [Lysinibacillus sphaericus]|nr:hypothetical protein [Lysinibacillus sphaericus]